MAAQPTAQDRKVFNAGYAKGYEAAEKKYKAAYAKAAKEGHARAMRSWRAWYEELPEGLREQIDAYQRIVRAAEDAA